MTVSFKDGVKLLGIIVVMFCAVFVCTVFLNFYLDAVAIKNTVLPEQSVLYNAQLTTAKVVCIISGGCLCTIALIMTVFYVKLYIDGHMRQLGILKAMGWQRGEIAIKFWVFGFSVLVGALLGFTGGYAAMPLVYKSLTIDTLTVTINFHASLLFLLVAAPAAVYSLFACGYAYFALRRPAMDMIKGRKEVKTVRRSVKPLHEKKSRSFLFEMCVKTLGSKKSLVFFVAFACFCFSTMIQMGVSMKDLSSVTMGVMITVIGVGLAVTTMFMAVTSLIKSNLKNIAMMKVFGYNLKECALSVFGGYIPFALLGFGLGTAYQYGLLRIMVDFVYKEVSSVPNYGFNVPLFFITLACFIVLYGTVMIFYALNLGKISVKEVMTEN